MAIINYKLSFVKYVQSTEEFEDPGVSDESWRVRNMSSYWEYQIHTIEDDSRSNDEKKTKPRKVNMILSMLSNI